jgi:PPOX class probable F420-dependent enzyme
MCISFMANRSQVIAPEISARLDAARIAHLASVGADRKPHLVPICFVWDGARFYSAIDHKPKRVAATQLKRLKNIQETPDVALLVDHYDEDWTALWYVLVRGLAELVSRPAEQKRAIQRLRKKYPQYNPSMLADDSPVLRITPVRIVAWGKM